MQDRCSLCGATVDLVSKPNPNNHMVPEYIGYKCDNCKHSTLPKGDEWRFD